MEKEITTYHIQANKKEIASTVLMVGDPERAKDYALKFLKDPKLICDIRSINIWTGTYNNHKVTIMGHGMGFSSIGIYVHELFAFFEVDRIIRLGSCATYDSKINLGELILGTKYYPYSFYGEGYGLNPQAAALPSASLLKLIKKGFTKKQIKYHAGGLYSSEWFYAPMFKNEGVPINSSIEKMIKEKTIIGKEMESYALQIIANYFNKEAITIATVIDNLATNEFTDAENKIETTMMGKIILEILFSN